LKHFCYAGFWMPEYLVDIFAEDLAHEALIKPLVVRLASESQVDVEVRVISARGGHPRVKEELAVYRTVVERGLLDRVPDLIVVVIDGNCTGYHRARMVLEQAAGTTLMSKGVIACPDPHVERWYMADPPSFKTVVGTQPRLGKKKCDRNKYKQMLAKSLADGGHPPTLGGTEFAPELIAAMDLYRAGKNEKSLKHFTDDLRAALHILSQRPE